MKIKKDGHLVEPLDPDVDAKSQKTPKKKQKGSEEPSRKRPRFEFDPKDLNEENLPLAVETSQKGKGKVTESLHRSDVDRDVDIPAEDRRRLKIRRTANRLEMDPPPSTPTGQTSGRGSNHILAGDTTKEVPPTSSKVPSDVILEESVSLMTTVLSNIIKHHGRKNQHLASLEQDLAHAKLEEEKLKATIKALEKEKSEMNARVALMERKDLYNLLEAKMEGFQIANHPGTIGGFENLNLTITKKLVEIPMLNLEEFEKLDIVSNNDERRFALLEVNKALKMWRADNVIVGVNFVRGHRTLQDEVDRTGIDACYQSLLHALKAAVGTLPNSLAVFEYMRSIFDSYVNPNTNPNVQPLVKGLDADDFSMDKFFGLQDPTSPDDVQASPDFEEDLRTNQLLRLQVEVRNLGAEPQRVTSVDAYEDPSSPPPSQIVPVPALVDLTQYPSSPENEGSEDQGWPCKNVLTKKSIYLELHDEDMQRNLPAWIFVPIHRKNHWSLAIIRLHNDDAWLAHLDSSQGIHDPVAIFHVLKQVLYLIVPIDPALVMTGIMNVEQQEDGHSCGKHVLQMLAGATRKESDGLDRCYREEGLRYIATLDQVRSFDVVFGMYLSGKLAGPPM
ncbi:hypothetical protein R1flu_026149 [Riccia fluitans]|uniref:Ubiquitin-like protease family profile domain-containing protein n=1 Tax=Riccia fluitans TaxID=41844 RepID=A0ABD1XI28_9MARC